MISINPIPALDSNYFWVIQPDAQSPQAFIVDPGAAAPVADYLAQHSLHLAGILITHHHRDHVGGLVELTRNRDIPVYGPVSSRIAGITQPLLAGDLVTLGRIQLQVIAVPGHTLDHIAYWWAGDDSQPPSLFCGDALFAGGCGKRYEGSAETMWQSLERLAALPDTTRIYCAHEYTFNNLRFALSLEPDNAALQERFSHIREKLKHQAITLPSQMGEEKRTNPFLRCHLPALRSVAENYLGHPCATAAEVFGILRQMKDEWS